VEGIIRKVSAPYSEQQNGILERGNRTVLDAVRSRLKHAGMLNMLWVEAVSTRVYFRNLQQFRAIPNSTPFERWTWKNLDISNH